MTRAAHTGLTIKILKPRIYIDKDILGLGLNLYTNTKVDVYDAQVQNLIEDINQHLQ